MRKVSFLLFACVVIGCVSLAGAGERKIIAPPESDSGLPFSPGIVAGDFLYLSGAIGRIPGSVRISGDIRAQTRQTLDNLGEVLKAGGMDFSHVVRSDVFLTDTRHFQAFNEIYRSYFPNQPPTRATVQADIAIPGALIEIAMVAARPELERTVVVPKEMKAPDLPYSWGILVGDTLFISGATSRNPTTYQPVPGDTAAQTSQVLENVGAVLDGAGMGYEDVVSCTVYLEDARDFQKMNAAYREFFPENQPARATVRARLMNSAFKTEIQCVAVKDSNRTVVVAKGAKRSSSPFSPAIQVGDRLYLSGFVGRGPDGYKMGDVQAQTRQALANLKATLAAARMDFSNIVNTTVFLSDIRHFQAMNDVYREFFPAAPPARATVGTQLMSADALVEIAMVASR